MVAMQTYLILMNFTTKGAETLAESAKRYERFEEGIRNLGGKVLGAYALLGEYDVMILVEVPDVKAVLKTVIRAASRGTATSKTLTAIPLNEFYGLVGETLSEPTP
jgi:uncharacterized protein with GYD domain